MSKKVVIVPKHKWCVIFDENVRFPCWNWVKDEMDDRNSRHFGIYSFPTRKEARSVSGEGNKIRKVSKIVYYYE